IPLLLLPPRRDHALADLRARLPFGHAHQLFLVEARDFDVDVDAVEQRAGDALEIALDLGWRAGAGVDGITVVAARARVHRRDHHAAGRVVERGDGAADRDAAVFERLAHHFQHLALE